MAKIHGHTKTLFLQNGKYYKWSYKHPHCTECGNCDHNHKGNGLCTSCWDKKRDKDPTRKEIKYKAGMKWHELNYVRVTERKKREKYFTKEMELEYKKQWYQENRPVMLLRGKIQRRKAKGLPCMEVRINGKSYPLPFESLEKPNVTTKTKAFEEWKKKDEEFQILVAYYRKPKYQKKIKDNVPNNLHYYVNCI